MSDEVLQGTDEWRAKRAGCVTMSELQSVLDREAFTYANNSANAKLGRAGQTVIREKQSRRRYKAILALERVNGKPRPQIETWAMRQGKEREPIARRLYEMKTGIAVTQTDFLPHHSLKWVGGSPDGLGEDAQGKGGQEIKCCEWEKHAEYLLCIDEGKAPEEHYAQVYGNMWNAGADWWDFAVFNPDFADHLQMGILRCFLDAEFFARLDAEVPEFLAEVEELTERFTKINGGPIIKPIRLRDLIEESSEWDRCVEWISAAYPDCTVQNFFHQDNSFMYDQSKHDPVNDSIYHVFRCGDEMTCIVASDAWREWALSGDTTPFL